MKLHEEAIGGLSAGIIGTIIGYPLDLVKTRMQTSAVSLPSSSSSSSSPTMIGVGIGIFRNEGFAALYRGMGPPLLSLSLLNTINFSSYSYVRERWYEARRGWDVKNGLAGATAGPLASSISTVEHMIKTQMQLDNISGKQYKNSFHCLTSLLKSHGISILYTGHVVNTVREAAFLGSYFYTYEGLKDHLSIHVLPPAVAIPVSGGCAGALAWFASFPLDCIKAGVQGQRVAIGETVVAAGRSSSSSSSSSLETTRKGAMDVARVLLKTKGIRGLYAGVTPSVVRAFLVSGSRFSAYELALWVLKRQAEAAG